MTDARRKAKIWLLQQKKTFADLALISGLAKATVHNALDGRGSIKSKQAVTNAIGAQLWNDVAVTERYIKVERGVRIEFSEASMACEWRNSLSPRIAIQRGRTIAFAMPCILAIRIENQNRNARLKKIPRTVKRKNTLLIAPVRNR